MKTLSIICVGVMLTIGCQKNQAPLETTTISAKTMVCGTCAEIIEKAVYRLEGVKEVTADVKTKMVTVKYVPEQTNVQTLEMAITDAGYDANNRKRNSDAYEKLDACCKIDM